MKTSSSMLPDWSKLPEELLEIISKNLEDDDYCFDVVHARSVCSSWRSTFPFPCYLLCTSYSLPAFPLESKDLCTLKRVPLFLFRVLAPEPTAAKSYLGGIGRDDLRELPFSLQCSVNLKTQGTVPTLMKMLDCQILPMGHKYRMSGGFLTDMVIFPPNKERGGEFVVLLKYNGDLVVLTSAEMRWKRLNNVPANYCSDLVTFRGRFYATFYSRKVVVIDPYSLEVTTLFPSPEKPVLYLVPSGNDDELFLVEVTFPIVTDISQLTCRVSRLDEEAGKWVEVGDLGDRILIIGTWGSSSCSAKELPHGCGLSRNSILFIQLTDNVNLSYRYGVPT